MIKLTKYTYTHGHACIELELCKINVCMHTKNSPTPSKWMILFRLHWTQPHGLGRFFDFNTRGKYLIFFCFSVSRIDFRHTSETQCIPHTSTIKTVLTRACSSNLLKILIWGFSFTCRVFIGIKILMDVFFQWISSVNCITS